MLVDKFFLCSEYESYRTGIVKQVDGNMALVQFDPMGKMPAPGMELVSLQEMATSTDDGIKVWSFFATRDQLDAFVTWLNSPGRPQVVKLVPKGE
jgi:hypothetical protein